MKASMLRKWEAEPRRVESVSQPRPRPRRRYQMYASAPLVNPGRMRGRTKMKATPHEAAPAVGIMRTAYPERSGWGGDDLGAGGRPGLDGPLDQPGEAVADEGGGAAIEPEDVLVEVGGEVLLAHRAVVGAQEPALDEAEHEMDAGQPERGVAPGRAEIDGL